MSYGDHRAGLHPESTAALLLTFMSETSLSLCEMASAAEVVAADCRYEVWGFKATKGTAYVSDNLIYKILTITDECRLAVAAAVEAYDTLPQDECALILNTARDRLNERRLAGS